VLQAAKLTVDGPTLLEFLQQRIPSGKERQQIELLLPELGQLSFKARQKASAELQKFGARAAGYLHQAAKSDDSEVARRAEQLLDKLQQSGEPALAAAVVRLLAVRRPPGAAQTLLAYYPWACDETVGKEVLYALVTLVERDPAAKQAVEAHVKDADPQKRSAATRVLGLDGGAFLKEPGRRVLVEGI